MKNLCNVLLLSALLVQGQAWAGPFAYLTNNQAGVAVLDTTTNQVTSFLPMEVARILSLAVSPAKGRVYVATSVSGDTISRLKVIDGTAPQAVIASIPTGTTSMGVAVSPNEDKVYVANYDDRTVSFIDAASLTNVANVLTDQMITSTPYYALPSYPTAVAVSPDGTKVYALCITTEGEGGAL